MAWNYSDNEYLKLYRKLEGWEWYSNPNTKVVFMHCLIKANWRAGSWHGINYKKGQFIASYESIAKSNGLTIRQVRTAIDNLIKSGDVTRLKIGRNLLFTVNNWDKYQSNDSKSTRSKSQLRHDDDIKTTADIRSKEDKNIKENSIPDDDYVSDEEWQRRLAEQDDDW